MAESKEISESKEINWLAKLIEWSQSENDDEFEEFDSKIYDQDYSKIIPQLNNEMASQLFDLFATHMMTSQDSKEKYKLFMKYFVDYMFDRKLIDDDIIVMYLSRILAWDDCNDNAIEEINYYIQKMSRSLIRTDIKELLSMAKQRVSEKATWSNKWNSLITEWTEKYEKETPDPPLIAKLKTISDNKSDVELKQCVICFVNENIIALSCGHKKFCSKCIIAMLKNKKNTCPICREKIISVSKIFD